MHTRPAPRHLVVIAAAWLLLVGAGVVYAAPVSYSGSLADPLNTALVGSGPEPSPATFDDDFAIANNVALYRFTLGSASSVVFTSLAFALGGVDPYFSLFGGSGFAGAFIGSNADQAFSTGGDFDLTFALAAGDYTFALGAFANMSFAENLGLGSLVDGFIGLGEPDALGDGTYAVRVSATGGDGGSVPEPSIVSLLIVGLGSLCLRARARRRVTIVT